MINDTERDDALTEIAQIARHHQLSASDIADFMAGDMEEPHRKSEVLTKLFAYLGGLFVFAGICIYAGMRWDDMNAHARIVITFGSGLVAYILAIACLRDERYTRAATPLFLIAGLLEPGGMLVTIAEYSKGGDERHALLVVFGIMVLQMALTFWKERRGVLLFLLLTYGSAWFSVMFDLLDFEGEWSALILGTFVLSLTWGIAKSRFKPLCPFWYFVGSAFFLCASWIILDDWNALVIFIAPAGFFLFLSVLSRSRVLLFNGVVAVLGFIGYYTAEYFADNSAWPLGLLIMGGVLVFMSKIAMTLNRKYISLGE